MANLAIIPARGGSKRIPRKNVKDFLGKPIIAYSIEAALNSGLYNFLRTQNIFTQIHYISCHLMPYYRELGWKEGDMPNAENYYKQCISLPMYPTLTIEQQEFVIDAINSFYDGNSRN